MHSKSAQLILLDEFDVVTGANQRHLESRLAKSFRAGSAAKLFLIGLCVLGHLREVIFVIRVHGHVAADLVLLLDEEVRIFAVEVHRLHFVALLELLHLVQNVFRH